MYTVKTYLDRSSIEGVGVFAAEDIANGVVVWEFVPGFDQTFTQEQVAALPERAREYMKRYAYNDKGKIHLNADHGPFTNHADNANTVTLEDGRVMACRDIRAGEEITCNYREFDADSRDKIVF